MITKYPEYWHFYFNKTYESEADAFAGVLEMFVEIADMPGNLWLVRAAPKIEILNKFEGGKAYVVYCRFSTAAPGPDKPEPEIHGFGAADA